MYKPGNKVKLVNSEHCTIGGWLHNTTAVIVDKISDGNYIVELDGAFKKLKPTEQSAIDLNLKEGQCVIHSTNLIDLEKITIDRSFFEHLLNCLASQKYIHSLRDEDKTDLQAIIDKAWLEGMDILHNTYY